MRLLETDLQKERKSYPSKFEFDTVAYQRGLITTDKEVYNYRRSVLGEEGERVVLDYLEEYGKREWCMICNMWMNHFGPFECDLILITRYKIVVFEIKNYTGDFVYKNGKVWIDGVQRNINPIHQARRNSTNIKELLSQVDPAISVEGALVFVGVNNAVTIESDIQDLQIIPRTHLMSYIRRIAREEQAVKGARLNPSHILTHLQAFEIQNDFVPAPATKEQMAIVRRGVYCARCKSYRVEVKRFAVTCPCGYIEKREDAILRAVKDYAILNYNGVLKRKDFEAFLDYQVSRTYLINFLNKHLKMVRKSDATFYTFDHLVG